MSMGRGKGSNQASIQEANRILLLRLLKNRKVCSRVELAHLTGLKQATITNNISELIRMGLVEEKGLLGGEKGRRAIGIAIKKDAFYVIGVRLTRQFFRVGLFNTMGEPVETRWYKFGKDQQPSDAMQMMIDAVNQMQERHGELPVLSACFSVPGPYFPSSGQIRSVTEFKDWEDINIPAELEKSLAIPVLVEHDANAGVIAEWLSLGPGNEDEVMVYLAVGQGVGAGIISGGKVFRGAYGTAGEVGHISMNALGERCPCGNRGCLTGYASTIGFSRHVEECLRQGEKSSLKPGFTFSQLAAAVRERDPAALRIFREDVVRYLGTLLVNLVWTYSPSRIVIGDEMAEVGDILEEELKQFVRDHILPFLVEETTIRISSLQDDPAFLGTADLAIDLIWESPGLWEKIRTINKEKQHKGGEGR